ncbi:hypothetical protein, partial [Geodermatophilus sp. CPCC 206100]|uniref:hypothetical protein n=1 Tax=Geodermatophilus sp. CPCC 206100 TaxID=3020054 RepID=UPI003B00DBFB
ADAGARWLAAAAAPVLAASGEAAWRTARTGAGYAGEAAVAAGRLAAAVGAGAAARASEAGRLGLLAGLRVGGAVEAVPEVVAEGAGRLRKKSRRVTRLAALTAGLGSGYVLGARAGQERFRQIQHAAADLARRPQVQQVMGKLGRSTPAADDAPVPPPSAPVVPPSGPVVPPTGTVLPPSAPVVPPTGTVVPPSGPVVPPPAPGGPPPSTLT